MKPCNGCGREQPLSEYDAAKSCKDGHAGTCKSCRREKAAERYRRDPEKHDCPDDPCPWCDPSDDE